MPYNLNNLKEKIEQLETFQYLAGGKISGSVVVHNIRIDHKNRLVTADITVNEDCDESMTYHNCDYSFQLFKELE